MSGKKQKEIKRRIYKNGLFFHPDKKGIVVAISPYGLMGNKYPQSNNHEAIKNIKVQ